MAAGHVARQHDDRGPELRVRAHAAAEALGQRAGELDAVALDGDVDVLQAVLEQQVAHGAADQVGAAEAGGDGLHVREEVVQAQRRELVAHVGAVAAAARLAPGVQGLQQVAASDDADDVLAAHRRPGAVAHDRQRGRPGRGRGPWSAPRAACRPRPPSPSWSSRP